MKFKFGQYINVNNEFYSGSEGTVVNYEYDENRIPEQKYRYKIRFHVGKYIPVEQWFWENEINETNY